MAESPVSSNCIGKVPTITSRAKLFPDIPKSTVVRGMGRGKVHKKNMRENKTVSFFSRIESTWNEEGISSIRRSIFKMVRQS
jgi:hypothetical protein